jgi:hypothetical protein
MWVTSLRLKANASSHDAADISSRLGADFIEHGGIRVSHSVLGPVHGNPLETSLN